MSPQRLSPRQEADKAADLLEGELKLAPLLTPHQHTTGVPNKDGSGGYVGNRASKILRESLHSQHYAMVTMLKAYLEYTRQNARKAAIPSRHTCERTDQSELDRTKMCVPDFLRSAGTQIDIHREPQTGLIHTWCAGPPWFSH